MGRRNRVPSGPLPGFAAQDDRVGVEGQRIEGALSLVPAPQAIRLSPAGFMNWPSPDPLLPLGEKGARGIELLDPVVAGVGDIDVAKGGRELAVAGTGATPLLVELNLPRLDPSPFMCKEAG